MKRNDLLKKFSLVLLASLVIYQLALSQASQPHITATYIGASVINIDFILNFNFYNLLV